MNRRNIFARWVCAFGAVMGLGVWTAGAATGGGSGASGAAQTPKVMSIPASGVAFPDMFAASSSFIGQHGVSFPGTRELALWWASNVGTGSNAWNYTAVDFFQGIHQIGHPYYMPSVSPPGMAWFFNGNAADSTFAIGASRNGSFLTLHQLNPWSDFNGICFPMAVTNVVGTAVLTNSDGTAIYEADAFGMQIGTISTQQLSKETNQAGCYILLSQRNYPTFYSLNFTGIAGEGGGFSQHSYMAVDPALSTFSVHFPLLIANVWNAITNSTNQDVLKLDLRTGQTFVYSNLYVGGSIMATQQVMPNAALSGNAYLVAGPAAYAAADNVGILLLTNTAWGPPTAGASAFVWDAPQASAYRLGVVKQNGAFPVHAHGSTAPWTIARSSTASLLNGNNVAAETMTTEMLIDSSGNLSYIGGSNAMTGTWHYKVPTYAKTANYTVLTTEPRAYFNNNAAAGTTTNTLPAATVGLFYSFTQVTAQNICVRAAGSDTIRNVGQVTSAGGGIFVNTLGAHVDVFCPVAGQWMITHTNTPWTTF